MGEFGSRNDTGATQIFTSRGTTRIIPPNAPIRTREKSPPPNPHENVLVYARIYANDAVMRQLGSEKPTFPMGSVIVREKLGSVGGAEAEMLSVMIKREAGFSRKTNDWEFLVIDGTGTKIRDRQTTGSCLTCHAEAKRSDMVFKTYLK